MQNLESDMEKLVQRIQTLVVQSQTDTDPHWSICQRIADEFELWDNESRFPLWLSYVVAGVIREHAEL